MGFEEIVLGFLGLAFVEISTGFDNLADQKFTIGLINFYGKLATRKGRKVDNSDNIMKAALAALHVGKDHELTDYMVNYKGDSLNFRNQNLALLHSARDCRTIQALQAAILAEFLKENKECKLQTLDVLLRSKICLRKTRTASSQVLIFHSTSSVRKVLNILQKPSRRTRHSASSTCTTITLDHGAKAFAKALEVNKTLREINLGWNNIGDAGAQAIGEALKVNTSLATLILDNKIVDAGATAIAKALQVNPILKQLFGVELKNRIQGLPQSKIEVPVSSAVPEKEGKKNQEPQPHASGKKEAGHSVLEAKVLKDGGAPFLNGRVMIAGRAQAGKTALARAFRGDPYLSDTGSTVGMDRPADVQVSRLATQTSAADAAVSWRVLTEKETKLSEGQRQLAAAVAAAKGSQGEGAADKLSSAHASLSQLQQERMHRKKQRPLGPEVPSTPTVRQCGSTSTSELLKPTASLGGNQQSGMQPLDKELVLRIEKGKLRGDELTLSVWDLGGQEVFRSLLQLFLKRGPAYLVLFDMRQLVPSAGEQDRRDCLDSLRFWMRSLEVHARDEALENPAPPVFLVGTHKDSKQLQLHEYRNHRAIEELLVKELGAFATYISRHNCKKTKDGRPLAFYPIDSTARNPVDPTIQALMADLDTAMRAEDFMKRVMPHSWIRFFDELHVRTQFTLTLQQALQIGAHCGLDEQETMSALFYMDDQGRVLHNQDDDHLRQLVVLDLSRFLQGTPESSNQVSSALEKAHIRSPGFPATALPLASGQVYRPTERSLAAAHDKVRSGRGHWFSILSRYFIGFCTRRQTEALLTVELSKTAVKENGFLPTGYFGRLVGKCIQRAIGRKEQPVVWTQEEFPVFKDRARLSLCGVDVQLELREELNVQVWSISREAYGSNIQAVSYLPFGQAEASASGQGWALVQLQALRKAVQTQQPLKVKGTTRNEAELRRDFDRSPPCWLPPLNEPGHWDFFLSHTRAGGSSETGVPKTRVDVLA
eukprot:g53541.t1